MSTKFIFSVLSVIMLIFISATSSNAYTFNNRYWPKTAGQTYTIYLNYGTSNTAYRASFDTAVSDWNSAQSKLKYVITSSSAPNFVGTQNVDDPTLYGTCFALSGNYFNATINIGNPTIVSNSTVRRSTAVHELGHGLGLSHEYPPVLAVMNSSRDRTQTYTPQLDDKNGINAKYPF
ncbi:matrixin family metalloprotease [Cytobacillus spongiae]|jgi:hypothetical protein|uniref:matrixin family metalloprotease n=1 Tax=Cytobacillus spongiae TaxID=2901381 RepID=UPI001F3096E7|nr:M57 family metalloprotease [Cytobacillus spongiae]UII54170.1 matrixin family metalloprotease [Cytobacillus spongiae]